MRFGRAERSTGWSAEIANRFGAPWMNGMLRGSMMESLVPTALNRMNSVPVVEARTGYAFADDVELSGSLSRPLAAGPSHGAPAASRVQGLFTAGW